MARTGQFAPVMGGNAPDDDVTYAQVSTDSSGNTVLIGPDGPISVGGGSGDVPLIVSFGDSILFYDSGTEAITSLTYDAATGIATANFSGAINVKQGDIVGIDSASAGFEEYEIQETEVLSYTTSPSVMLTYRPNSAPSGTDSGGALLRVPWHSSNRSVMAWVRFLTKQSIRHINAGRGGDTGTKMLARFDTDVAPHSPDFVLVSFGTNDLYGATARTSTEMMADLEAMHAKCLAIGAKMVFLTSPPQGTGRGNWSLARVNEHHRFRARSRTYCVEHGIAWFDWISATVDTVTVINATDTNGAPNTAMLQSDNIHPTRRACYAAGKKIATWLNHHIPQIDRLVASAADADNLLSGGLFAGTGGSGADSGDVATGWTVTQSGTVTVAGSVEARTVAADGDACGNNQVLTISAAASGASVTITSGAMHTLVSAGDVLDVLAHLQVTGQADVIQMRMFVSTQSGTTGNKFFYDFSDVSATRAAVLEDLNGVMACENIDFRTTANGAGAPSAFTVAFTILFGTSGAGACVFKVGRATCYKKAA